MEFKDRLEAARKHREMSQTVLAAKAKLQPAAINHFEAGRRSPSFDNLRRLADALEVSVDYLLGRANSPVPGIQATDLSPSDVRFRELRSGLTDKGKELLDSFAETLARTESQERRGDMGTFDYHLAERYAEQIINEAGLTSFPIDPIALAENSGIKVQAMPPEVEDYSGALVRSGNKFGILYSTSTENEGRKRFSVAHELGHYHLPDHPKKIGLLGDGKHQSRSDFRSNNPIEREADAFASALLMPKGLTLDFLRQHSEIGLNAIKALRIQSKASLTASALRYVKLCDHKAAIVVSSAGVVEYCFVSQALSAASSSYLRPGSRVPQYTATSMILQMKKPQYDGQTTWDTWFGSGGDADVYEEVIVLTGDKLLTVLTLDSDA